MNILWLELVFFFFFNVIRLIQKRKLVVHRRNHKTRVPNQGQWRRRRQWSQRKVRTFVRVTSFIRNKAVWRWVCLGVCPNKGSPITFDPLTFLQQRIESAQVITADPGACLLSLLPSNCLCTWIEIPFKAGCSVCLVLESVLDWQACYLVLVLDWQACYLVPVLDWQACYLVLVLFAESSQRRYRCQFSYSDFLRVSEAICCNGGIVMFVNLKRVSPLKSGGNAIVRWSLCWDHWTSLPNN